MRRRDPDWGWTDTLALAVGAVLFAAVMVLFVASDREGKLAVTQVVYGWAGK